MMLLKGSAYRTRVWYMSKDGVISIMNNSDLIDKMGGFVIIFINV